MPSSPTTRSSSTVEKLEALDTVTASLVARQSRSDDGSMSVPDQVEKMRAWCEANGIAVGNVYTEYDVSGRKPLAKRKGLLSAVEDVEAGRSQMILTAYFDRFVRSTMTRAEVLIRVEEKMGGSVMTLDMGLTSNATPVSKFTGTVLAAASELIAEQAGERTAVTKQSNIDKGIPPFPRITPAYQRREDGTLEPHPVNGPLVREACRMRADGVSFARIARWLEERGLSMTLSGVESMLSSRLLVGEIHFGSFTPNLHAIEEPIIDHATFRRMESAKSTRGRYAKSERLLARLGVLVCESCGGRMTAHSSRSGAGKSYPYYRCPNRSHGCDAPASVACDVAEAIVVEKAIEYSAASVGRASAKVELEALRIEREAAEDALASAIRTLAGLGGEAATREVLDGLQQARDVAVAKHERLQTLTAPDRTVRTSQDWDALTIDEKRDVIVAVVASARVTPGRGADRVAVEPRQVAS